MLRSTEGSENYDVSSEPEGITPDAEPGDLENREERNDEDFATATEDPARSLKEDDAD